MAELEHLGVSLLEIARVLNELVVMVRFPVHSCPVMQLAVRLLRRCCCPGDADAGDVVSYLTSVVTYVVVVLIKIDNSGSIWVFVVDICGTLLGLFLLFFLFLFFFMIIVF